MEARDMDGSWHQLVLIWIRDPAQFQDYLSAMAPIVSRYGGAADRLFAPTALHADELTTPDAVNLVHYDDRAAFAAFNQDPDFQQIKHLRDESVDLLSFEGRLARADPAPPDPQRVYGIEIVRFPDGSRKAYERYEREGESVMGRYGFQVEHVLDLDTTSTAGRRFDLVKISSFPSSAQRAAFETDPEHARIEQDLYPAAVADLIWIDATLRPAA
jgi:uncharacterized protein (DUF1330 family)